MTTTRTVDCWQGFCQVTLETFGFSHTGFRSLGKVNIGADETGAVGCEGGCTTRFDGETSLLEVDGPLWPDLLVNFNGTRAGESETWRVNRETDKFEQV